MSRSIMGGQMDANSVASLDRLFSEVVETAMAAWAAAQSELDRLLQVRIDGLMGKMLWSLGIISFLTALSIWIAIMTHRYTVRPLDRLEQFASEVRETKDYSLRIDDSSTNEIGQLAAAFNDMLSELAVAREREHAEQAQHARAARLMTAGAMTASIAHEISQPLASIVASSSAAQRWLARSQPNIQQARTALERIARDGHRASEVIGSVRAMFNKESRPSDRLFINDIIHDTLSLVRVEAESNGIRIRTELTEDLPPVIADRGQLQQVLVNLFSNAGEAMRFNHDREPILTVRSDFADEGAILIVVEDTGVGIDPKDMQRIFDTFYTTKSGGMGVGLSICRSIIEAHGGQLWASRRPDFGSAFHLTLPVVDGHR
jgi:signal transduction histidine kinase